MKTLLEAMDPGAVNYTMMQTADLLRTIMGFGSSAKSDAANPQYSYTVQIASGANHESGTGKECAVVLDSIMSRIYANFGGFPCARNTENVKDREDRKLLFLISVCIPDVASRIVSQAAVMRMSNAVNRFSAIYSFYKDSFHSKIESAAADAGDAVLSSVNLLSKSPVGYDNDTSTYDYLDKLTAWNRNVLDTVNNVVNATGVKAYVSDREIDTAVWMVSVYCMLNYINEYNDKILQKAENVDYVHIIGTFLDMIAGKDKTVDTVDETLDENDADEIAAPQKKSNEKMVFRKDLTLPANTQRGTVTDKTQFTGRFVIGMISANYGALLPTEKAEKYAKKLVIAQEALKLNGLIGKTSTIPKTIGGIVDAAAANIASNPISDVIAIRKRLLDTLYSDKIGEFVEKTLFDSDGKGKKAAEKLIIETAKEWLYAGNYKHTGTGVNGATYVISGTNQPSACFGDEAFNDKNAHNGSLTTAGAYVSRHMVNDYDNGCINVENEGTLIDQIPFSQLQTIAPNYVSAGVIEMIGADKSRYYGVIYGINAYAEVKDGNFADLEEISPFTAELSSRIATGARPLENKKISAAARYKSLKNDHELMQRCVKSGFLQSTYPTDVDTFFNKIGNSLNKINPTDLAAAYRISDNFVKVCQSIYNQFDAVESTGEKSIESVKGVFAQLVDSAIPSGVDLINNSDATVEATCNKVKLRLGSKLGILKNQALIKFIEESDPTFNFDAMRAGVAKLTDAIEKNHALSDIFDTCITKAVALLKDHTELCDRFGVTNQEMYLAEQLPVLIGQTFKNGLKQAAADLTAMTVQRYISLVKTLDAFISSDAVEQLTDKSSFVKVGHTAGIFSKVYHRVAKAKQEADNPKSDFSDTNYDVNQIPEGRELGKASLDSSDVDVASGYELNRIQNELASEDLNSDDMMQDTDYVDNLIKLLDSYHYYTNREKELSSQIEQYQAEGGTVPKATLDELEQIRFVIDSNPMYQETQKQLLEKKAQIEQEIKTSTDAGQPVPANLKKQLDGVNGHLERVGGIIKSHRNGLNDSVHSFIKENQQVTGVANAILSGKLTTEELHLASVIVNTAGDILNQLKKKDVTYAYTMSDITAIAQTVYTIGRHVFADGTDVHTEWSDLSSELNSVYQIIANRSGNPLSLRVIGDANESIARMPLGKSGENDQVLFATYLIKIILKLGRFIISNKSQYADYLSGKAGLSHVGLKQETDQEGNPIPSKDDAIDALARTQVSYGQTEHSKSENSEAEINARRQYIDAVRSEMKENTDLAKYAYSIGVALNHFDYSLVDPRYSKSERISRMYNSVNRSSTKGMLLGSTEGSTKIASNYIQMEVLNAVIDDEQSGNGGASGSYPEVKKVVTALLGGQPVEGYAKNYTNSYSEFGGYASRIRTKHYMGEDNKGNVVTDSKAGMKFTIDQIFNRVNPEYADRDTTLDESGLPSDECVKSIVRAARQLVYTNVTRNIGQIDELTGDVDLNGKYAGKAAKEAVRSLYRLTNDLNTPISYIIVATMHVGSKAGREALISDAEDVLTGKKGDGKANIDDMAYISNMAGAFPQKMTDKLSGADDMWINTVVGILRKIPSDMSNMEVRECLNMYNGSRLTRNDMIKNSGNYTVMYKIFARLEQLDTDSGINAGFFGDDSTKRKETLQSVFNYVLDDTVEGNTDDEKRKGQLDKILAKFAESSAAGSSRVNFNDVSPTEAARIQIAHMRMNPNSIGRDIPFNVFADLLTRLSQDGYIKRITKSSIALKYPGLVFDWNTFKYFARQLPMDKLDDISSVEDALDVVISSHLTGIPVEKFAMLMSKNVDPKDVDKNNINNVTSVFDWMCDTEAGPIPVSIMIPIIYDLQQKSEDGVVTNEMFLDYIKQLKTDPNSKVSYSLNDVEHGATKAADGKTAKSKKYTKKKSDLTNPVVNNDSSNSNIVPEVHPTDENNEPTIEVNQPEEEPVAKDSDIDEADDDMYGDD